MFSLGLMSGTASDGLSIALAAFKGRKCRLIAYQTFSYPRTLADRLLRMGASQAPQPIADISKLHRWLGDFFAAKTVLFLKRHRMAASRIRAIGSHGHTLYHGPGANPPSTFQIGEPSFLAERTGIPVVSDFRQRDLAARGEGAPLIPFFDQTFFGNGLLTACQNIGGIANVTLVGRGLKRTVAFDNGPGNCLMDEAMRKTYRRPYDEAGRIAGAGRIHFRDVMRILKHPFFRKAPPKSTGRELFHLENFKSELRGLRGADLMATLAYVTARSIADSYRRFLPRNLKRVIVSGGGAKNGTLMRHLKDLLMPVAVESIERWGISAQAKEPMAFAYLALCAVLHRINHLPEATGARAPRILGKITY